MCDTARLRWCGGRIYARVVLHTSQRSAPSTHLTAWPLTFDHSFEPSPIYNYAPATPLACKQSLHHAYCATGPAHASSTREATVQARLCLLKTHLEVYSALTRDSRLHKSRSDDPADTCHFRVQSPGTCQADRLLAIRATKPNGREVLTLPHSQSSEFDFNLWVLNNRVVK